MTQETFGQSGGFRRSDGAESLNQPGQQNMRDSNGLWRPATPLQPVPRIGHEPKPRPTQTDPQAPGWNLQWRRSPNAPAPRSNAAVAQVSASKPIASAVPGSQRFPTTGREQTEADFGDDQLRPALGDLQLRSAEAHSPSIQSSELPEHPLRSQAVASRRSVIAQVQNEIDYFSNPFGDDERFVQGQAPASSDDDFENLFEPDASATEAFSVPAPPSEPLPGSVEDKTLRSDNPFREPMPSRLAPTPSPGEELAPAEEPSFDSAPGSIGMPMEDQVSPLNPSSPADRQADGPSLKDLIEKERPDAPLNSAADPPADRLSEKENEDFDNPFKNRDADQRDRDRLNSGDDAGGNFGRRGPDDGRDTLAGLSCDDFRKAIREQTIDQVSLDISDPYRPDEIDLGRYQKLKQKFDEKQAVRTWRNITGTPLATGRLRDLAYEQVVIETEFGAIERVPMNQLSESDRAFISEAWGIPNACLLDQVAYAPRSWTPMTVTWKASNVCRNPLYFEDVNLERYGHTHGPVLEPLVQTAHFFGNIAVLPYKMGVHHPNECQYSLGYYRPGNCAPWIKPPVPISLQGAYNQAAVMTGLFWLIP